MNQILLVLVVFALLPGAISEVWGSCPFGEVNDAYPGNCGSYVDSNGDSICDYSQPEPGGDVVLVKEETDALGVGHLSCGSMRGMPISEIAGFYGVDAEQYAAALSDLAGEEVELTDIFGDLEAGYGLTIDGGKGIAVLMKEGKYSAEEEAPATILEPSGTSSQPPSLMERYNFIPITLIVLLTILLSELLIKNKLVVRYFWNVALLVSFTAAAITSLIYFFQIGGLHAMVVTLHIELGLIAVWIGLYHMVKMFKYYTRAFPKRRA